MKITDLQAATLRAQLAGQGEEHQRLLSQLTTPEDREGYSLLLAVGFFEAVNRRFQAKRDAVDNDAIIDFVANLRARTREVAERLDPVVAEKMILHALGKGDLVGIDENTKLSGQILILSGLIADSAPTEAELDAFMSKVKGMAQGG
ncbi:hypothetical protein [Actinomadura livida]|uniref:Uncharacterized protein n=1 Tax=Actinomadura livida TaxID=79909 RepID=A0A7W7MYW2_9ACTN|nr:MULTISPECIES: hypothetical protein [Actinomadura]MBB4776213.1 hypothetical protein [Actinomadura catellatispora]GGU14676.1 hypothetical protein GCM10010208_44480 [Actinomadura livida]